MEPYRLVGDRSCRPWPWEMPLSPSKSPLEFSASAHSPCIASRTRTALLGTAIFAACRAIDGSGLLAAGDPMQLAYLDPGAGSFVIQAVVATLAGVAVAIRAYWSRIRLFFGGQPPDSDGNDTVASSDDE